jgi:enamine deaminase RidA (YjgF/YER057c/UK114 family)
MWQAQDEFLKKHCPDLVENPRAATLLKDIKLDLPDMRIEIEVVAVTTKK